MKKLLNLNFIIITMIASMCNASDTIPVTTHEDLFSNSHATSNSFTVTLNTDQPAVQSQTIISTTKEFFVDENKIKDKTENELQHLSEELTNWLYNKEPAKIRTITLHTMILPKALQKKTNSP